MQIPPSLFLRHPAARLLSDVDRGKLALLREVALECEGRLQIGDQRLNKFQLGALAGISAEADIDAFLQRLSDFGLIEFAFGVFFFPDLAEWHKSGQKGEALYDADFIVRMLAEDPNWRPRIGRTTAVSSLLPSVQPGTTSKLPTSSEAFQAFWKSAAKGGGRASEEAWKTARKRWVILQQKKIADSQEILSVAREYLAGNSAPIGPDEFLAPSKFQAIRTEIAVASAGTRKVAA